MARPLNCEVFDNCSGTDMVATAGGSSSETIEVGAAEGTIDLTGAAEELVDSDPEGYDTSEDSDDVAVRVMSISIHDSRCCRTWFTLIVRLDHLYSGSLTVVDSSVAT